MQEQEPPYFSIIVPTYNRADQVVQAVNSVLEQSFRQFEIIVVDDGSEDATEQRIKEIPDQRLRYFWKENEERGAARNYGIKKAKGTYINFLDSDDRLYPDHLAQAYQVIKDLEKPEVFHLAYDKKRPDGSIIERLDQLPSIIRKQFIKGNPLSCNGVFLRSDIAGEYPFVEDRHIAGSEDWVLWMRLAARFDFHNRNTITSSIIEHDYRSVLHVKETPLVERKQKAIEYAFRDKAVRDKFGAYKKQVRAHALTYIALHLALAGKPGKAIKYAGKAGLTFFPSLFNRRALAIIKHSLLPIFNFKR